MQPLAPAVKSAWRVKIALFWGIVLVLAFVVDLAGLSKADRVLPLGVMTSVVLLLGGSSIVVLPALRYRFWRYELRAEELALTRGIWNRVHTIVPLRRIQHLDVSQDVIERNFELGRLIVHTAGTQGSSVVVPGLDFEEAERLRSEVKTFINEYAV
jgi:membrane protein YdbS with pleckstrin-like domain